MNFDLYKHTVFLTAAGSHAYGMATEQSDYDYRGIAIPPLSTYISLTNKFEHCVDTDKGKHVYTHYPIGLLKDDPRAPDAREGMAPDMQVYEITKFMRLALDNNPSILEYLFTDPRFFVMKHPLMDKIIDIRHKFLSKACKARFSGYAIQQLKRIERHRGWLLHPPKHKPTRAEFGLPEHSVLGQDQLGAAEALIQGEIDEFMIATDHLPEDTKIELRDLVEKTMRAVWVSLNPVEEFPVGEGQKHQDIDEALVWGVAKNLGFSDSFIDVLNREKKYRTAKKEWDNYLRWQKERNPARAEIEAKFQYDCKHAAHLYRLLRSCRDILTTGDLKVYRPDAQELLDIRNGALSYEEVVNFAKKEDLELSELVKNSSLPKVPPVNEINQIVYDMVMEFCGENK